MNIYFYIIVSVLLMQYLLSFIVRVLNISAISSEIPEEFKDVLDKDKYLDSQKYTKVNSQFSYFTSTFSLIISFIFIFGFPQLSISPVYNEIDLFVRSFAFNNIVSGIIFFGILILITDMLNTPFGLYKTFVIEQKFGFNKMKLSTYISDKIKGYFLILLIGAPLVYTLLYFFESFDTYAWFYAWVLLVFFSLIIQPIYNVFIAPIYNKFTPLAEGGLLTKIEEYLLNVEFPVKKLEVMDGSKRSGHSNAYFSGMGSNKRIALFDTLVDQMEDDEILSVIAHEVGHYKLKHIHFSIFLGAVQSGIMMFILSLFINNRYLFNVFGMQELSIYASLVFFGILYSPISIITNIFFNIISRKNEFEADKFSAKTANMPESLISGLKKMSIENLSNLSPHWLNVFINYSHPPVLERIKALKLYIK